MGSQLTKNRFLTICHRRILGLLSPKSISRCISQISKVKENRERTSVYGIEEGTALIKRIQLAHLQRNETPCMDWLR